MVTNNGKQNNIYINKKWIKYKYKKVERKQAIANIYVGYHESEPEIVGQGKQSDLNLHLNYIIIEDTLDIWSFSLWIYICLPVVV